MAGPRAAEGREPGQALTGAALSVSSGRRGLSGRSRTPGTARFPFLEGGGASFGAGTKGEVMTEQRAMRSLAQKWRPGRFEEVLFESHVVRTLSKALADNRIAPCYLFVGGRGLGKTSTARILAKGLNCEKGPTPDPCGKCVSCREIAAGSSLDVLEIDAASHGKVEDARELIERARLVPVGSRYKVYILDEAHMLTQAAWNALLKTLEEPPPHCVFVLATTEGEKVPETIRSRSIRFDFRPVSAEALAEYLAEVARREGMEVEPEAISLLARRAEGAVRDGLVALDQARTAIGDSITAEDVADLFGLVPSERIERLRQALASGDARRVHDELEGLIAEGRDLALVARDLLESFRRDLLREAAGEEVPIGGARLIGAMEALIDFFDKARVLPDLALALEASLARIVLLAREKAPLEKILYHLARLDPEGEAASGGARPEGAQGAPRGAGVTAVFPGARRVR